MVCRTGFADAIWFTRIRDTDSSLPDSGADSDENCGPVDVDESYRLQLRELVITPVLADTLLPSADFMVYVNGDMLTEPSSR